VRTCSYLWLIAKLVNMPTVGDEPRYIATLNLTPLLKRRSGTRTSDSVNLEVIKFASDQSI
jgi:hypothetical protein